MNSNKPAANRWQASEKFKEGDQDRILKIRSTFTGCNTMSGFNSDFFPTTEVRHGFSSKWLF